MQSQTSYIRSVFPEAKEIEKYATVFERMASVGPQPF